MAEAPIVPTRERILDVSRALFASHGYHGSSIRDIAGELGVSVSAVYNHFRSKDAILLEVLRRPIVLATELIEEEMRETEGCEPAERLARCLRRFYGLMLENTIEAELVYSEHLRLQPDDRATVFALRNRFEDHFKAMLADCLPAGERDAGQAAISVAVNVALGLTANIHRWFRDDGPMSKDEMVDFAVRFAMAGIAGALGTPLQEFGKRRRGKARS